MLLADQLIMRYKFKVIIFIFFGSLTKINLNIFKKRDEPKTSGTLSEHENRLNMKNYHETRFNFRELVNPTRFCKLSINYHETQFTQDFELIWSHKWSWVCPSTSTGLIYRNLDYMNKVFIAVKFLAAMLNVRVPTIILNASP